MENAKNVKALKKQLVAAIAMVLVAAIALASSTYAWFVSNNKVTATTTNISAQSNSAYLVIDNKAAGKTTADSKTAATASETTKTTALYPAQWANTVDTDTYQFESAYASDKTKADEKTGTRFAVGTPAEAVDKEYALLNTFYVGTGTYDGEFTKLKVSDLTVTATKDESLKTAMRLLVMAYKSDAETTAAGWAVVKYDGTKMVIESQSDADGVIYADQFGQTEGDVVVKVYAYYDGADKQVYTDNLANLIDCGATVTFEATPAEYK